MPVSFIILGLIFLAGLFNSNYFKNKKILMLFLMSIGIVLVGFFTDDIVLLNCVFNVCVLIGVLFFLILFFYCFCGFRIKYFVFIFMLLGFYSLIVDFYSLNLNVLGMLFVFLSLIFFMNNSSDIFCSIFILSFGVTIINSFNSFDGVGFVYFDLFRFFDLVFICFSVYLIIYVFISKKFNWVYFYEKNFLFTFNNNYNYFRNSCEKF